jgi:RND family efflux transporter MFP subunit
MTKESLKNAVKNPFYWAGIIILIIIIAVTAKNTMKSINTEVAKPQKQKIKVSVIEAKRGEIQQWVTAEGTVRSVKREFLKFEQPGKVTFIGIDVTGNKIKEGSRVRGPKGNNDKGQLIASIDDRQQEENLIASKASIDEIKQSIKADQAALEQAKKNLEFEQIKLARAKNLYEKEALSADELESMEVRYLGAETAVKSAEAKLNVSLARESSAKTEIRKANILLEQTKLYAPFDGIVSYLNIKEGEYYSPQNVNTTSEQAELETTPVVLIDPDMYEITLNLPLYDGRMVNIGQDVFITWGDNMIPDDVDAIEKIESAPFAMGQVYSVNPSISPGGRTIQVKVRTTFGSEFLRDGLFVTCWIIAKNKDNALLIPYNSVIYREMDVYVFVYNPETKTVTKRQIKTGIEGMRESEIIDGISEGDLVITEGRFSLVDGAPVEVINIKGEQ